jgi:hypothetical protein
MAMTTKGMDAVRVAGRAWELAADAVLRIPRGRFATVVRVERGTVLVTQEGDRDDHVLERGDQLVLSSEGLAVAWAFTEAEITVHELPITVADVERHGLGHGARSAPAARAPVGVM